MTEDRFRRIELMLGPERFRRLQESRVTVVGLGAVGSYAVEGLARAGIGSLRLVDFDVIAPSNINRQLYALESTVGRPKCEVARERVLDINPSCAVEAIRGFVDAESVEVLIGRPDLVIDAIDSLNPKTELVAAVRRMDIPLISCLGAALRTDPTCVRIAPLEEVRGCPLGRKLRKRLQRRGVSLDFPCVFSEEPLPEPLPIESPSGSETELERGRARNVLGSLPTLTGIFGLVAANLAIRILSDQ
jgi:tRNA A37 threonylcarbamoyladenosine dehydratase